MVVKIQDAHGNVGIGGAAPSPHYGESPATDKAVLPELLRVVERLDDPHRLASLERNLKSTIEGNPAARSAVSIALHDLVTKGVDLPSIGTGGSAQLGVGNVVHDWDQ